MIIFDDILNRFLVVDLSFKEFYDSLSIKMQDHILTDELVFNGKVLVKFTVINNKLELTFTDKGNDACLKFINQFLAEISCDYFIQRIENEWYLIVLN
jgi:hypothetical protein